MTVEFVVYGTTADDLYEHARGALTDFGPNHEWDIKIDVDAGAQGHAQATPDYWHGHVTATERRTP